MKPRRVFRTLIIPCICLSGLGLPFFLLHAILASIHTMHKYVYGHAHVQVHTSSLVDVHWVFFASCVYMEIFVGLRCKLHVQKTEHFIYMYIGADNYCKLDIVV